MKIFSHACSEKANCCRRCKHAGSKDRLTKALTGTSNHWGWSENSQVNQLRARNLLRNEIEIAVKRGRDEDTHIIGREANNPKHIWLPYTWGRRGKDEQNAIDVYIHLFSIINTYRIWVLWLILWRGMSDSDWDFMSVHFCVGFLLIYYRVSIGNAYEPGNKNCLPRKSFRQNSDIRKRRKLPLHPQLFHCIYILCLLHLTFNL